jgi:Protein of unknown function (DUF790)
MQLFGDHKLARCIVACLAATYRHRCRSFAEVLPAERVKTLGALGITNPSELRLWLFRQVNSELPGFVGSVERAPFLRKAGGVLGLEIGQIEMLLSLDSPEHAILSRSGPKPTATDTIARFNFSVVAAILATAPTVSISLAKALPHPETIRDLCAVADIQAELTGRTLVLHGRQDALDGWTRHGLKLARLLAALLTCGLPAQSGEATVAAPGGEQWLFRLNTEIFAYLGMPRAEAGAEATFSPADLLECWRAQEALITEFASIRRAGEEQGWTLRRATEPLSLAGAILPTFFVATRARQRVFLVPTPRTESGAADLAEIAAHIPLITLHVTGSQTLQQARPSGTSGPPQLPYSGRGDIARLPALLTQAAEKSEKSSKAQQLETIFEEALDSGVLTEQQLAESLTCAGEELSMLFARPEAVALAKDYHAQYIEGFGLCTVQVLMRARAVARDVASLRDRTESAIQRMRVLGRRLREVTGASEGIECLIAYLGAA